MPSASLTHCADTVQALPSDSMFVTKAPVPVMRMQHSFSRCAETGGAQVALRGAKPSRIRCAGPEASIIIRKIVWTEINSVIKSANT